MFRKHSCKELEFLDELLSSRERQYRQAYWLKNSFQENIWYCDLGNQKIIDFRIKLPDGKLLTDLKHAGLLETLKCFLCIQTHFDITGGKQLTNVSAYQKISRALHIIDYLLLHAGQYQLVENGLTCLSTNELKAVLLQICSESYIAESVYQWTDRVTKFLESKISTLDKEHIRQAIKHEPELAFIRSENRVLLLTDEQLIAARIWLKENGFYKSSHALVEFKYSLNTRKLSQLLFKNTLSGRNAVFRNFNELSIYVKNITRREYTGVPTTSKTWDGMPERIINKYYNGLRAMGCLARINLDIPATNINDLDFLQLKTTLTVGHEGRFSTLPSQIVFFALRNSIEFALKYGETIVQSYLNLINAAIQSRVPTHRLNYFDETIERYLTPELIQLGVKSWSLIDPYNVGQEKDNDYFVKLRNNEGLYELVKILYACVQICVGTLMARRQDELKRLKAFNCIDKNEQQLIFYANKTGYAGKLQKVVRPIPKIAIKLIRLLETIQKGLIEKGIITQAGPLFRHPNNRNEGLVKNGYGQFNLDLFCDYFEMPLNKYGRRYYIRQHQLRRFFAMLFFWGNSFGGMDTLRWFLAHTDIEHLYYYITESTVGSVLQGAKAHYATEKLQELKNYDKSLEELADVLEKHFGTRRFDILDADHLDVYIEDLLAEGAIKIEPEFFDTPDGRSYRILIKVISKEAE